MLLFTSVNVFWTIKAIGCVIVCSIFVCVYLAGASCTVYFPMNQIFERPLNGNLAYVSNTYNCKKKHSFFFLLYYREKWVDGKRMVKSVPYANYHKDSDCNNRYTSGCSNIYVWKKFKRDQSAALLFWKSTTICLNLHW